MERRVVLRHLSGSKANQVEQFPAENLREIMIGCNPSCDVKYEPDREELVARHHAKLLIDSTEPLICSVMDLNSRNGTFVNRQRIFAAVRVLSGDVVQLGAGGPEFEFDVDPRPEGARPTRVMASAATLSTPLPAEQGTAAGDLTPDAERRIWTRKLLLIALLGILAILVAALAVWNVRKEKTRGAKREMSPAEIAQANSQAVVLFESRWKLIDKKSGRQLSHVYQPNAMKDRANSIVPIVAKAGGYLPVFVQLPGERTVEPMLSSETGRDTYKPVGGVRSGSGVVVSRDGLILTSRAVAAAWHTPYDWQVQDRAGIVYILEEGLTMKSRRTMTANEFPVWIPMAARFVLQGAFDHEAWHLSGRWLKGRAVEGRSDYLDVTFAGDRFRNPAKLARVSERFDAATVRIERSRRFHPAELNDNLDTIKSGDTAIVMSYAVAPPDTAISDRSSGASSPELATKSVPDPTVTVAGIGRVGRERDAPGQAIAGAFGDVYQLTMIWTGSDNSGGPLFDRQGRVIGIYGWGRSGPGGAPVSFAVPIRYGMQLMGK